MNNTIDTDPFGLIVASGSRATGTLRDVLAQYAQRLRFAGAFAGLSHLEAGVAAATIAYDVTQADEGAGVLRGRAQAITDGWWTGWCADPGAAAHTFRTAAAVLDAL